VEPRCVAAIDGGWEFSCVSDTQPLFAPRLASSYPQMNTQFRGIPVAALPPTSSITFFLLPACPQSLGIKGTEAEMHPINASIPNGAKQTGAPARKAAQQQQVPCSSGRQGRAQLQWRPQGCSSARPGAATLAGSWSIADLSAISRGSALDSQPSFFSRLNAAVGRTISPTENPSLHLIEMP